MGTKLFVLLLLGSLLWGQEVDSVKTQDPATAAKWALIFPGVGQIYTGHYVKAGILAGLELAAIWRFNANRIQYRDFSDDMALKKHRYLEKRNKYAWWAGFIYIYGLLDAVVDAHLSTFDQVMEVPIEGQSTELEKDREQDL